MAIATLSNEKQGLDYKINELRIEDIIIELFKEEKIMKINIAISKLSLKTSLCNRSSIFILLLQAIIPVLVMFYFWSSILKGNETIGGLTNYQMIIYYIGVNFVNFFVWYAIDWELNDDIHSGEISNILHRPISLQRYYFNKMIGDRIANIIVLLPILFSDHYI